VKRKQRIQHAPSARFLRYRALAERHAALRRNLAAHGRMPAANGAVLWQGASLLDGAPIVVIATGLAAASSNRKTGAMVQTYILRSDVSPVAAVKSGADVSICGDCPHRGRKSAPALSGTLTSDRNPSAAAREVYGKLAERGYSIGRTCYVNVGQGPLGVWRAFKRGIYPVTDPRDIPDIGRGRAVRLGTYGDPAAVPVGVWTLLTKHATGRTGYTHQWRKAHQLRGLCMASVDSEHEAQVARATGWRYFRVAMPSDLARMPLESVCPASAEAGKKLTCAQCLACAGADGRRGSIVIQAHGGFAVMAHVNRAGIRPYFARQL
jgi:hypothetical protein